ncbi:hypothetical protein [Aeromicrobium duanguangcaii]|uniref:WD40 repeat domain-containing protein n=1 Tax=Aeromicrobium duanguangcaii TaxID=2968086 RepID=A0ABY5KGF9_9ACTN|nr:hypothetical protein [Aeromicrobium duanguangcaii]MCD9155228.1 hypothetical protein [Aeromicrobium duanguangcaii]UUI68121.1 hypothetical protein NP095_13045 [Aeromicrobium duanguangcaii]
MNPRHRRLLIPGLLIALIAVVVVASLIDRADAAVAEPVTTLSDSRITESSGLAVSTTEDDLAYTVNDSGNAAEVFAVDLTSGAVVGVTTVRAEFRDVEALALRDGTLWIGDVGDNGRERDDLALYAIDEPGRTTATVDARRFPVSLEGGPADVEALLAPPSSDRLQVVTKTLAGAEVLTLSEGDLDDTRTARFRKTAEDLPALVTDGAYSPDGSRVALLSYGTLWSVDPTEWSVVGSGPLPSLEQSETVAFVSDGAVLVGSEGSDSPLYRLTLPTGEGATEGLATVPTATAEPSSSTVPATTVADDSVDSRTLVLGGIGVAGLLVLVVFLVVRRGRSGGSRRALR